MFLRCAVVRGLGWMLLDYTCLLNSGSGPYSPWFLWCIIHTAREWSHFLLQILWEYLVEHLAMGTVCVSESDACRDSRAPPCGLLLSSRTIVFPHET